MKKNYTVPEMEIIFFSRTDVMLASASGYQSDPFDQNPFEGGN